jgi:hypothetical protein
MPAQTGVTVPGTGRLQERPWADAELAQIRDGADSSVFNLWLLLSGEP